MLFSSDEDFEHQVRNVASQIFPFAHSSPSRYAEGRERDGLFDDGECVHIFEATTSRKVEKVKNDISKSVSLVSSIRREKPSHNVKIWIVTSEVPTADQLEEAVRGRAKARCPVEVISFNDLYSKLFDARSFMHLRDNYNFGSVRNPDDSSNFKAVLQDYIPIGAIDKESRENFLPEKLAETSLNSPNRFIILGDFGAGKSMYLWSVYRYLQDHFIERRSVKCPIYLNLRDHWGQSDPAEALIRHATKVGFPNPASLIGAWRAGYLNIILDGFDELSPNQMASTIKFLKDARKSAAKLIYCFMEDTPCDSSIYVSGRLNYFDDIDEMYKAINVRPLNSKTLNMSDFTESQIKDFLSRKGFNESVPNWLPRRPLLLGYLSTTGIIDEIHADNPNSVAEGWNDLLDRVCDREVRQVIDAPVDGASLRRILENLASRARVFESGRGPISGEMIDSSFRHVFNVAPDDRSQVLLMRLPGLSVCPGTPNSREFIDDDFTDACRAGDIVRFVCAPFHSDVTLTDVLRGVGDIAIEICRAAMAGMTSKQASSSVIQAVSFNQFVLALDILKAMIQNEFSFTGDACTLKNVYVENFEVLYTSDMSSITFEDCIFERLVIESQDGVIDEKIIPKFQKCIISNLYGLANVSDLPASRFGSDVEIENVYGAGSSNAEILESSLPLAVSVLMTIIRKTFFQAGGARQEAALYRGLDHRAKAYVAEVLAICEQEGLLVKSSKSGPPLWQARREKTSIAREIWESPMASKAQALQRVRKI